MNSMTAISGLLKPCYVYAPGTLLRRLELALGGGRRSPRDAVRLPWGATIAVNTNETIGRELVRQNVFDIGVSETAWRLLAPGDVAVDVGANIGYMTGLFAARVGRSGSVYAFEPHPRIFGELERNAARFAPGSAPAQLFSCAIGASSGFASLLEPEHFGQNEGTAKLATTSDAGSDARSVRLERLDVLCDVPRIALLKIDVEGAEADVLAGADRLLSGQRSENVIYEAHDCERSHLHVLLQRRGFAIFGIGYGLRGLKITPGLGAPRIDRAWESPSYLATLRPTRVLPRLAASGWRVLRGRH